MRKTKNKYRYHRFSEGGITSDGFADLELNKNISAPNRIGDEESNSGQFNLNGLSGIGGAIVADISDVVNAYKGPDTSLFDNQLDTIRGQQFVGSNADLRAQSASLNPLQTLNEEERRALGERDDWERALDAANSAGRGALAFGQGTGWNGWAVAGGASGGLTMGIWHNLVEADKVQEAINIMNRKRQDANMTVLNNLNTAVKNRNAMGSRNIYEQALKGMAFGGFLETNGSNWDTGVNFIDNGGTHQENPFGGVQYGIASDGLPNLVEEGEVVIKVRSNPTKGHSFANGGSPTYEDFVVSDREFPILEEIADSNITENPEQYVGKSWAEIYKDIFEKSHIKEVINRKDSKDYIDSFNERVAQAHELTKLRNNQEKVMQRLKDTTPEEQDLILQQAGYPNLIEEAAYAAHGGKIYIKPSKRGTFTAAATKHGMGVQEFASKVLANKEDYSEVMRKKAQFAKNASKWHAEGGYLFPIGGYIPYDNSNGFEYFVDDDYTQEYKDWLNSRDWTGVDKPVFDRLSAIYKQYTGKTLTPEIATNLGQDRKFGPFHRAYGDEFARYNKENKVVQDNTTVPSLPIWRKGENVWLSNEQIPLQVQAPIPYRPAVPDNTAIIPTTTNNEEASKGIVGEDVDDDAIIYHDEYERNPNMNADGIIPFINGMNVAADIAGITNYADYRNANILPESVLRPMYIGYNPVTRHQEYNPVDRNFLVNRMINSQRATDNLLTDMAGGNPAMAAALLTNANYNNQTQIGEAILKAAEQDLAAKDAKTNADNQADLADAQNELTAARSNQSAYQDYARNYLTSMTNYAKMREDIDNQVAANRSANWNNFLENMQAYFDNQRNRTMANDSYGRMYGYNVASNGNITFDNASSKRKFAKDYNIDVEDVDKVKRRRRNGVTKFYLNDKELTRKG